MFARDMATSVEAFTLGLRSRLTLWDRLTRFSSLRRLMRVSKWGNSQAVRRLFYVHEVPRLRAYRAIFSDYSLKTSLSVTRDAL